MKIIYIYTYDGPRYETTEIYFLPDATKITFKDEKTGKDETIPIITIEKISSI